MIEVVMTWLAAVLVGSVVAIIVLAAVAGWGARVSCWQRGGLLVAAAGMLTGAYGRLLGHPVGAGDVALFGGWAVYLLARHGPHILRRADRMDGVEDGRIAPVHRLMHWGHRVRNRGQDRY